MDLTAILADLKAEQQLIEAAISALEALDGKTTVKPTGGTTFAFGANRPKRHISRAGRARIAAAARARWAKRKGNAGAETVPAKPKRRISPAGRARIIAATKARWARVRAAKQEKPTPKARVMSAAARKRISEAAKARWAKIKTKK